MSEPIVFADQSMRERIGFKGPNAAAWLGPLLAPSSDVLPAATNTLAIDGDLLIGRLAWTEYAILSLTEAGDRRVAALREAWERTQPAACFPVPRFHAQAVFALEGAPTFELLATMSPIDFRPHAFPAFAIAQTTCAKVVVQIYCRAREPLPRLLVAVDQTLAAHLSESIAEAMHAYR